MRGHTLVFVLAIGIAVILLLLWQKKGLHPTAKAVDASHDELGASVEIGGAEGPAKYSSNVVYLSPPPLSFMMPILSKG
jgi:hypothetical protein